MLRMMANELALIAVITSNDSRRFSSSAHRSAHGGREVVGKG
jgi:hypothetical protein